MIFFRKRLLIDTDPTGIAKAKSILEKNGIPYEEKTSVSENSMSRSFNAAAAVQLRAGYDQMSSQVYVYKLYVPRRRFAEARALTCRK